MQRGAGGCKGVQESTRGCRRARGGAGGRRRVQEGAGGCKGMQEGAGGCKGVAETKGGPEVAVSLHGHTASIWAGHADAMYMPDAHHSVKVITSRLANMQEGEIQARAK